MSRPSESVRPLGQFALFGSARLRLADGLRLTAEIKIFGLLLMADRLRLSVCG